MNGVISSVNSLANCKPFSVQQQSYLMVNGGVASVTPPPPLELLPLLEGVNSLYRCRIVVARTWTTITIIITDAIITVTVSAISCIEREYISTCISTAVITVVIAAITHICITAKQRSVNAWCPLYVSLKNRHVVIAITMTIISTIWHVIAISWIKAIKPTIWLNRGKWAVIET